MGVDSGELNTITVAAHTMLLTETSGTAVHLTHPAGDGDDPQPAIPSLWQPTRRHFDPTIDLATWRAPVWASRTLCGIRWNLMAGADPTNSEPVRERAPTCRRCLAIIDRWFPPPVADDRIALLAVKIGQAVHDYGTAEVVGVPGDQTAALRRAARDELKHRFGYTARTYLINDLVVISSSNTTEQLHRQAAEQFHRALGEDDDNTAPIDDTDWRFHWQT
jgi:hypothetical protein